MSGLIRRSHNATGGSVLLNLEQLKIEPIFRCTLEMHLSSKSQGLINVEIQLVRVVLQRVARHNRSSSFMMLLEAMK